MKGTSAASLSISSAYHIKLQPTASARSVADIILGLFNCVVAPLDEEDGAALPVADPDPEPLPGSIFIVTLLMTAGELFVEFVSVVPLISHPSSVLFAPNGGVCGPSVPFFRPPVSLVGWFVLPWTQ